MTVLEELNKHAGRVSLLADQVACHLEMTADEREDLALAARLHDIGKVVVPDSVATKAGPLDEVEWRLVRWHTQVGERMVLQAHPSAGEVAAIVRYSHERWDGFGYPDGLAGEAIPLGARIIFACDAFDALTSERAYRERLSAADALRELRRCSGTQFDPEVVEALGEVLGCR